MTQRSLSDWSHTDPVNPTEVKAPAHTGAQDAPTQAGLRLAHGIRSHACGGVEDDARW
jgi:hypothetical protein